MLLISCWEFYIIAQSVLCCQWNNPKFFQFGGLYQKKTTDFNNFFILTKKVNAILRSTIWISFRMQGWSKSLNFTISSTEFIWRYRKIQAVWSALRPKVILLSSLLIADLHKAPATLCHCLFKWSLLSYRSHMNFCLSSTEFERLFSLSWQRILW